MDAALRFYRLGSAPTLELSPIRQGSTSCRRLLQRLETCAKLQFYSSLARRECRPLNFHPVENGRDIVGLIQPQADLPDPI
jgi:hypothetical protein